MHIPCLLAVHTAPRSLLSSCTVRGYHIEAANVTDKAKLDVAKVWETTRTYARGSALPVMGYVTTRAAHLSSAHHSSRMLHAHTSCYLLLRPSQHHHCLVPAA